MVVKQAFGERGELGMVARYGEDVTSSLEDLEEQVKVALAARDGDDCVATDASIQAIHEASFAGP